MKSQESGSMASGAPISTSSGFMAMISDLRRVTFLLLPSVNPLSVRNTGGVHGSRQA